VKAGCNNAAWDWTRAGNPLTLVRSRATCPPFMSRSSKCEVQELISFRSFRAKFMQNLSENCTSGRYCTVPGCRGRRRRRGATRLTRRRRPGLRRQGGGTGRRARVPLAAASPRGEHHGESVLCEARGERDPNAPVRAGHHGHRLPRPPRAVLEGQEASKSSRGQASKRIHGVG
jgi:hypothetical protein